MRVVWIPSVPSGVHPGVDVMTQAMRLRLEACDHDLIVMPADRRRSDALAQQARMIEHALELDAQGIVLEVQDMTQPQAAVHAAVRAGRAVVAIHAPRYAVSAAVIVPHFQQGVMVAQHLSHQVRPGARVGLVGGSETISHVEFMLGLREGLVRCGLQPINDPFDPAYRNLSEQLGDAAGVVQRLLDSREPPDALAVFNDLAMADALDVLQRRQLAGRLPIVSRNGSPLAVAAVRAGWASATLDPGMPELGVLTGDLVCRCLNTSTQRLRRALADDPLFVTAPIGHLVTTDNAHAYRPWTLRVAQAGLQTTGPDA